MDRFFNSKILPAVTVKNTKDAVKLAHAFLEGGLNVMEITFRTSATIDAIKAIREEIPEMIIGAGTILSPRQIEEAANAGASFGLAPGLNADVVDAAKAFELPFIPGVMTPSEVELALSKGCLIQKLFPAGQLGGVNMIKALSGPYAQTGVQFIPMGGVNTENMQEYLSLESVIAVGGSWLCDHKKINNGQFDLITDDVRDTMARLLKQ